MSPAPLARRFLSGAFLLALATLPFLPLGAQETLETEELENARNASDPGGLLGFVNSMPELVNHDLPFLESGGSYWFYIHPRLGNPLHGKYFKMDTGGWLKLNDQLEVNLGVQSYVWRDVDDFNHTRYGLYGLTGGVKYDQALSVPVDAAMSYGVNYSTPVSRPPRAFTDGYRHTNPYVAYTQPLDPDIHLVGFTSVGLDLLEHSKMPTRFGKNQLHSNALGWSIGASREWRKFAGSLTLNSETSAIVSKHALQRFELNPEIYIPLYPRRLSNIKAILTLSGRAVHGPDGYEFGGGVSVHLSLRHHKP